jgi:hypothetical protein
MADLEKLAIKRDRGYLFRLIVLVLLGLLGGGFFYNYLTSANVGGCVADAFLDGSKGQSK